MTRTRWLLALTALPMLGCGNMVTEDKGENGEDDGPAPANLIGTSPADGQTLASDGQLLMTFDSEPGAVSVNGTPATVSGETATWQATGLTPGETVELTIEWTSVDQSSASSTLTLTVEDEVSELPCVDLGASCETDDDCCGDSLCIELEPDFGQAVEGVCL